ncbi:MAG: hypothetical protein MI784_11355 [Cytophagales bacterium]|nr:hypothetical protein [Cytophagales bacterium]
MKDSYHQIPDKFGWNTMRKKHKDELKILAYNFFAPIFKARQAKSWEEVPLLTIKPEFMQEFFGDQPLDIFGMEIKDNKPFLKEAGKWLRSLSEKMALERVWKVSIPPSPLPILLFSP